MEPVAKDVAVVGLGRSAGGLDQIPSYVEDTGEVNWLVGDALQMEARTGHRQAAVQLFVSRDEGNLWARSIAMMRHGFGGHPFAPHEAEQRERRTGRVGDFYRRQPPS